MEEVFCDATSCVMRNATTNMGRSLFAICLGILVNITHGFCISNVAWTSKIDFHAIMIFCRSKSLIVETILLLLTTLTCMICLFYHELEKALKLSLHFLFEFGCNAICCNSKHFYQDSFGIYFQEKLEIQCKDQFFLFVLHSFFTLFYLFCFDFVCSETQRPCTRFWKLRALYWSSLKCFFIILLCFWVWECYAKLLWSFVL